jgi:phage baseplate assembly protein W
MSTPTSAIIPHFDFPFTFSDQSNAAVVVDQDSVDDVANCVAVAILTPLGFRPELPTFGVPEQLFLLQPLSLQDILAAIELWEQRAYLTMSQLVFPPTTNQFTNRTSAVVQLQQSLAAASG